MVRPVGGKSALALAVSAALVASCVQTSVRVVQMVPGEAPHERIFVVVYEGGAPAMFARQLLQATMQTLGAHGGAREGRVLTGLEFDTRFLDQEIDRFGAQAVLTIKPLGSRTGRHGEIVGLIYGATLTERPSDRPLWAAKIEISGAVGMGIPEAAGRLVDALAADHLIP
jgi:hypothetical protein